MKLKFKKIIWLIILPLLLFLVEFCKSNEEIKLENKSATVDNYWDDLATYISGLPLNENNRFLPLSNLKYYNSYTRSLDKSWGKIEKNYIKFVSEWSKEYLPKANEANTAVYPLSGADFIQKLLVIL